MTDFRADPPPEAVRTFGVKEFTGATSLAEGYVEAIRLTGFTIVPGVLADSDLVTARAKLDGIYEAQVKEIGGRHELAAIGDPYTAMCLLAYDDFFLSLAMNPRVLELVGGLLGDYFILMLQNGILNVPDVGDQQTAGHWHRDLGYQHFVTSRPIGITALYCIDAFDEDTGGTTVLPGSHKAEAFPSPRFVLEHQQVITADAGSVLLFDSMLYHRGGRNRSRGVRRAVNNVYTMPFVKQQISLPRILNGRHGGNVRERRLLGYDSETDANVVEFRRRRLARLHS